MSSNTIACCIAEKNSSLLSFFLSLFIPQR
jgi:hypothetical protein